MINDHILETILLYTVPETIYSISSNFRIRNILKTTIIREKLEKALCPNYLNNDNIFVEILEMSRKKNAKISNETYFVLLFNEEFKLYSDTFRNFITCTV